MNYLNHNLKIFVWLFCAGICSVSLLSCEKVIDLELDNAESAIVIDAGLSDRNEVQLVKISKTYSFTESNRFNGTTGAKVVLTTAGGGTLNYVEVSPGVYQSVKFRGRSGIKYTLDVTLDGKTYSASSTMPAKVLMDSLSFKQFTFFGEVRSYIAANYTDPAGIQNQYRYVLRAKGKVEEDVVSEDRFDDGNTISSVIFYKLEDLVTGDSIQVEFQCIDRNVYRYFYSMGQNSGEGGPPVSPANPPSNFNNGALGVFSAYTSSIRTAVIR